MSRVSTLGNYNSALLNLFSAQTRQFDAQQRIATGKVATDLQGFGRSAESLTALKGAQARIEGFIETSDTVLARVDTLDLALTRVSGALDSLRAAIGNAIANESGTALDLELEAAFQGIRGGLNVEHQGQFALAGGNIGEAPVSVATLDELAAAPDVASVFTNGALKATSRISEATTLETGFLASDVGTGVFSILRELKLGGPFAAKLTTAQKTFLTGKLSELATAGGDVQASVARNGAVYQQVQNTNESNKAQLLQLETLVGKRTDADLGRAAVDIKLSEVAIQASAQVINGLRNVSLLNFLT